MTPIDTYDLPESLQELLLEVEQTKTPLTINHQGKPLVIVYPAKAQEPRPAFGFMEGSGEIIGDIVTPVEQVWDVLQ
jgi:antitoxin VapB